jgi:4-hydroxy-2-oxoheptanedioate aldolase
MDLPKNAFKAALKANRLQIGVWCSLGDTNSAELLAGCGYDWMLFDTEHSPVGVPEAAAFLRTVAPYPVSALVRPAWNDMVLIKKYLDIGAQTLLLPYVQSADEAAAAVRAARYGPEGLRGVSGMTRANRYGEVEGYATRAAEEICVLVQCETELALSRIEEIAAVPGVDGIFIGPADLAASLGLVGQTSHPQVKTAVLDGIRRIRAAGLPPGFLAADAGFVGEVIEAGAVFVSSDIDLVLLRQAAKERRKLWP